VLRSNGCSLGKRGEDLACCELRRRGYEIVERRYRTRHGEIDIIARDAGVLVFVEVKARSSDRFGAGVHAVTVAKQRQIAGMASHYLSARRLMDVPCRFDVVSVLIESGQPAIDVIQGAFESALS
jgi:putative endonuclease